MGKYTDLERERKTSNKCLGIKIVVVQGGDFKSAQI